jgi:hypothetical protein
MGNTPSTYVAIILRLPLPRINRWLALIHAGNPVGFLLLLLIILIHLQSAKELVRMRLQQVAAVVYTQARACHLR